MGGRGANFGNVKNSKVSQNVTSRIGKGRDYIGNLRSFEHNIRHNNYETAGVMDRASGKLLWGKTGTSSRVSFTKGELADMRGRDVTHNHPSGLRFSTADVKLLVNVDARSVRAAGRRGTYILKKSSRTGKRDAKNFSRAYTRANNAARKKWSDKILNAKRYRDYDRKNKFFRLAVDREMRKWLKERAMDYGYVFKFDRKHK